MRPPPHVTRSAGPVWPMGAVIGAIGLVTVLTGTFLPWLVSGGVYRNSYAIVGVVGRLGLVGTGFGATVLSSWPLLGPVAALAFIAGILRRWRSAAAITLPFGLLAGVIGGGVLAVAGGHGGAGVAVVPTGPMVTAFGGMSAVIGALLVLVRGRDRLNHRPVSDVGHVSREPESDPSRRPADAAYHWPHSALLSEVDCLTRQKPEREYPR